MAEPVAEIEWEVDDDPTWKRAKLNTAGMQLKHGTLLYTSQPDTEALRQRVKELEEENAELQDQVGELENPTWPEWAEQMFEPECPGRAAYCAEALREMAKEIK